MASHPKDQITTDEREAILEEGREQGRSEAQAHVTPRPDESSDRIRRVVPKPSPSSKRPCGTMRTTAAMRERYAPSPKRWTS